MDASKVSLVLLTKDPVYPPEILNHLLKLPWGEVLILTHSDSPYRKHELFKKAKMDYIFYADDDAIVPAVELLQMATPDIITLAIKQGHYDAYKNNRASMGLGWGAIFSKKMLESLRQYTDIYGEDDVYKRETERIFTYLNYPQQRLILPIVDLPSATDGTRLWQQPEHNNFRFLAEARCRDILKL